MARLLVSSLTWGLCSCNSEQMNSAHSEEMFLPPITVFKSLSRHVLPAVTRPESKQLPGKGVETPGLDCVWLPC